MKRKNHFLVAILAVFILNTVWINEACAAASSAKGSSSSSSGARVSSSSSRVVTSKSAMNAARNVTNRSAAASSSSIFKNGRSNVVNNVQRSLNRNTLYKGNLKNTLNQKAIGNNFHNFYFPYWFIFGSQNFSKEQTKIISNLGAKTNDITSSNETRYWLLIQDNQKKKHAVLVSKEQFEKVKINDEVQLINKQLIIRNKR